MNHIQSELIDKSTNPQQGVYVNQQHYQVM